MPLSTNNLDTTDELEGGPDREKVDIGYLRVQMSTSNGAKPTVFMVVNANLKGGLPEISPFVESQAESLRKAGWEVFFGVVDDRTSLRRVLRNVRKLKVELAQVRPKLVHAQYGSVTAAVANKIKGPLPLVVSFCGDDLLGTPIPGLVWRFRELLARAIGLFSARSAAAIIVKSNNLFQALPASLKGRATLLPNGVDTGFFRPLDRDECRAKLGWSPRSRIVLFNAGQNGNQECKNVRLARAAVDLLTQAVPGVSLHLLSNAHREEVRLIMNAADCLLVTSLHEGSPNIVKEAMSCNLPVVSVPCGDVPDRLRMTYPGGIRPYIAGALAEAIQEVFKSGCRSNGREQLIAQGLAAESVADRLCQIYCHVLEENSIGGRSLSRTACVG
jgi:teichuronic acid biosynthesis glycosyltransferase TuaC